jgi:hypothetical protein
VLRPGFGPGSPTRKAGILDRTILPEPSLSEFQISKEVQKAISKVKFFHEAHKPKPQDELNIDKVMLDLENMHIDM